MDSSGLALVAGRSKDTVWAENLQKLGLTASCHESFGRVWDEVPFQSTVVHRSWFSSRPAAPSVFHDFLSVLLGHDTFFIGRLHKFLGADVQWQYVRPGVMLKERVTPDGLNDSRWDSISSSRPQRSRPQSAITEMSSRAHKFMSRPLLRWTERCLCADVQRQHVRGGPSHSVRFVHCASVAAGPHQISPVSSWSTISWLLAVFTDNFCKYALGVSRPGWSVVCVTLLEMLTAFLGLSVRFALWTATC